jgi:glutamyl-Q tRNA(Asp) synthetase
MANGPTRAAERRAWTLEKIFRMGHSNELGGSARREAGRYIGHYVGRFAPSPTGPLHAGSLVAALASWLDARAHGGCWLVRLEDVDAPRCPPGTADFIFNQLTRCGLVPDAPPLWQSTRTAAYAQALAQLAATGQAYPCTCSRKAIEEALRQQGWAPTRHGERPYPGTCRQGCAPSDRNPAWRLRTVGAQGADVHIAWHDRRLGPQQQNVSQAVGDFVLKRADGLWAYQLAVVVDDAAQGITHVVRGEDLADNTPRQMHLQQALGLPTPLYLHTPLVLAEDGQKLSKQNGAQALDLADPLRAFRALQTAGLALGLPPELCSAASALSPLADWLAKATQAWAQVWPSA